VLILHSSMPHPHEFSHLKPDKRFVLLTDLITRVSEFLKGILRDIGFFSIQEPFKEDAFISDKSFTLLI
jgi:hypothetical protein